MEKDIHSPSGDESVTAHDLSQFLLHSKTEINYILRALMHENILVTAYFNQGGGFILTSILMIDAGRNEIILDYGTNEASNRKLLESPKIIFVTSHEKVKVQFSANQIVKTQFQDRDAFRIKFPDAILKLQRREYYRLITPIANPLKCSILTAGSRIDAVIADVSLGGVGVMNLPPEVSPQPGMIYRGCRIVFPEIGTVTTGIEIKNVIEVTLKSGAKSKRYGCEFADIPASMQALIQRYIIKQDRERRAKLAVS